MAETSVFLQVSEVWPQGHWMGFSGMATGLVLEAWLLGHWMGLSLARAGFLAGF